MQDTLLYILKQIVDHPDDVTVESTQETEKTLLTIKANSEDMGRIIGKNGRIIRAIRDLIKLVAVKENTYVDIVLAEE